MPLLADRPAQRRRGSHQGGEGVALDVEGLVVDFSILFRLREKEVDVPEARSKSVNVDHGVPAFGTRNQPILIPLYSAEANTMMIFAMNTEGS